MRLLQRLRCFFSGHRYRVIAEVRSANAWLGHLHYLAGCDADCERCGHQWRDADNFRRWPWIGDLPEGHVIAKARGVGDD